MTKFTPNPIINGMIRTADQINAELAAAAKTNEQVPFGSRGFISSPANYGSFEQRYDIGPTGQPALILIPNGPRFEGGLAKIVSEMHDILAPVDVPEGLSYAYEYQASMYKFLVDSRNRIYLLIGQNGAQ